MRAVICRKSKGLAGDDGRESAPADAKAGKALRKRRAAAECESKRTARKGTAGYLVPIVHWQKS
jgi:hypothetical protein